MKAKRSKSRASRWWLWVFGVVGLGLLVTGDLARRAWTAHTHLAAPAGAQAQEISRPTRPPPPLLSEREVQAGLNARLERMQARQAAHLARKSQDPRSRMLLSLDRVPPRVPPTDPAVRDALRREAGEPAGGP